MLLTLSQICDTMKIRQRIVRAYKTAQGRCPFEEWLRALTLSARVRIQTRLDRVEAGNFGDHKFLQDGVFELRIHTAAGLRVYYGLDGDDVILLLLGGGKRSQRMDIRTAKGYWADYLPRRKRDVH